MTDIDNITFYTLYINDYKILWMNQELCLFEKEGRGWKVLFEHEVFVYPLDEVAINNFIENVLLFS